jgi:hypothetical protein
VHEPSLSLHAFPRLYARLRVHALTTPYVRGSSSRLRSMASVVAALTPPSFSLLPPSLVLHVFSLLPVDVRARRWSAKHAGAA